MTTSKGGPATVLPPDAVPAGDPFDTGLIARLAAEFFSAERGGTVPGLPSHGGLTSPYPSGASEIAPPVHPGVASSVAPAPAPAVPSGTEEANFGERPCVQNELEPDAFPYDFRARNPPQLPAAPAPP